MSAVGLRKCRQGKPAWNILFTRDTSHAAVVGGVIRTTCILCGQVAGDRQGLTACVGGVGVGSSSGSNAVCT